MGNHHNIRVRAGPVAPPARPRPGPSPPESVPWCAHPHKFLNHPHLWLKESEHFGILCRHLIVSPSLHPGGMSACSRWLSGAIPPEPNAPNPPAPRPGCQSHHYSIRPSPKNIKNPRNNTFYALNHTLCSGLRLSETSRSARIVASHPDATWGPFVPSVHWTPQTHRKSPK